MMGSERFKPGEAVLLREIWQGKIWTARPMILVRDTPEILALYWMPETLGKRARNYKGEEVSVSERKAHRWVLEDGIWWGGGTLRLSIPNARHSVLIFRDPDGTINDWYINLEYPLIRTDHGFDYTDMILDLIVDPGLKTWYWKDDEEFKEAQTAGLI